MSAAKRRKVEEEPKIKDEPIVEPVVVAEPVVEEVGIKPPYKPIYHNSYCLVDQGAVVIYYEYMCLLKDNRPNFKIDNQERKNYLESITKFTQRLLFNNFNSDFRKVEFYYIAIRHLSSFESFMIFLCEYDRALYNFNYKHDLYEYNYGGSKCRIAI